MATIFLKIVDSSTYHLYSWGYILFCNYKNLSKAGKAGVRNDKVNTL